MALGPGGSPTIVPARGLTPGGGANGFGGASGGAAAPGEGGATPTIVPFIAAGRGAAAPGAPEAVPSPTGLGATGEFIISMVPLNFGAAAPLRLKPHLVQVVAVSGFCVPQFGQNKLHLQALVESALQPPPWGTGTLAKQRSSPQVQKGPGPAKGRSQPISGLSFRPNPSLRGEERGPGVPQRATDDRTAWVPRGCRGVRQLRVRAGGPAPFPGEMRTVEH